MSLLEGEARECGLTHSGPLQFSKQHFDQQLVFSCSHDSQALSLLLCYLNCYLREFCDKVKVLTVC